MVSSRCKVYVEQVLKNLEIAHYNLELGYFDTDLPISIQKLKHLSETLQEAGLEVLDNRKNYIIEKTKAVIENMLTQESPIGEKQYSKFIADKAGVDYQFLSKLFSETKGITLQQFIIIRKVEKIKELLLTSNLSLGEIAFRLQYSSVPHLSHQFKKITGITPSYFKRINLQKL